MGTAMRHRGGRGKNASHDAGSTRQPAPSDMAYYHRKKIVVLLLVLLAVLVRVFLWDGRVAEDPPPTLSWWQTTIIYQIYPRSYQDSDGDGVGDIRGIIQRLDYIRSLSVRAIWLSPIFRSPMRDFGYDISNYTDIDPTFGNLEDFDNLISAAHDRGIKVILDFVPNHSSVLHPWFQLSRQGVAPYKDYYVWTIPGEPPNNWLSLFRGPAWALDSVRGELYYHAFMVQQPDLNWRCAQLVEEMDNVLRFWMSRGVDGFRVDAIQNLFETENLSLNEPPSGDTDVEKDNWYSLRHDYTFDLPEIGGAVRRWRDVLNEYEARDGKARYLVVETLFDNDVSIRNQYYDYGADMPFNFDFLRVNRSCGGHCIQHYVNRELGHLSQGQWPNFVVGNHDNPRVASKMGKDFVNAVNMLLLTLPGTPTTYYGEELGMSDVHVSFDQGQDLQAKGQGEEYFRKYSRDPSRTPMQWNGEKHGGFTSGRVPWLPVSETSSYENVEHQTVSSQSSPLNLYRKLAVLRNEPCFQYGGLEYGIVNDNIFSYTRSTPAGESYLVTINFGHDVSIDNFANALNGVRLGEITLTTENFKSGKYHIGDKKDLYQLELYPGEGLIIKLR
ncbi:alpha-glucosidase-like isoform X1 [Haliotis rufescens]|uniref:alpha-glucosidase-like isoform X1 n=1 Tax=Haliotis rufescens TaxID=6454 RepID=UPI00201F78F0|nr:alpha-glucosidase-like isoform X1 [Haliotis rufescens]